MIMKFPYYFLLLGICASLTLISCTNPLEDDIKCPCDIKLLELIPDQKEPGTKPDHQTESEEEDNKGLQIPQEIKPNIIPRLRFTTKRLTTLNSPRYGEGSVASIRLDSRIFANGGIESIKPEVQYIVSKNGVVVPKTMLSMEILGAYAIMEDLTRFDEQVGVNQYLHYPRIVSLQTVSSKGSTNNASYSPVFDRIFVMKYRGKGIPLSLNKGVLAHEHAHAIFSNVIGKENIDGKIQSLGMKKMKEIEERSESLTSKEKISGYNFLLLRSLDEGLADFWAHIVTENENSFLGSFTPEEMSSRTIRGNSIKSYNSAALETKLNIKEYFEESSEKNKSKLVAQFLYLNGTKYATFLKYISKDILTSRLSLLESEEAKVEMGKWILESLIRLQNTIKLNADEKRLTQEEIVFSFVPQELRRDKRIKSKVDEFLTVTPLSGSFETYGY